MEEKLDLPRLLVAAPASGSGKTTVTCALLRVFQRRGLDPSTSRWNMGSM